MIRSLTAFLLVMMLTLAICAGGIYITFHRSGLQFVIVPSLIWVLTASTVVWLVRDEWRARRINRLPRGNKGSET